MYHPNRTPKLSPHERLPALDPLYPPETEHDAVGNVFPHEVADSNAYPPLPSFEPPSSRLRNLVYQHSGVKERRDRTIQRNPKYLLVVFPPPCVLQNHGRFGHTLSLGPRHRMSSGILMSLFPTMYGQLTAIAREFSFPSITGLCLYLHLPENGITATPRISDESWPCLWGHYLEAQVQPSGTQLPVVGRIEFDLDMGKARWYASWMAASNRDRFDSSMSPAHSLAPSFSHCRIDSKSTLADPHNDDPLDGPTAQHNQGAFPNTHGHRRISLLGSHVALPVSRAVSPPAISDVDLGKRPLHSQIQPASELPHAAVDRVESWRASAGFETTPLPKFDQMTAERTTTPKISSPDHQVVSSQDKKRISLEVNLQDFTWSISSAGPGSFPTSPVSTASQVPTPDVSRRVIDNCPLSPSIATSWGPPSSYPPSPTSDYRCPSVDIAHRHFYSRPATPSTVTSWGAPSWDGSYENSEFEASVDIGERVFESAPPCPMTSGDSSLVPSPSASSTVYDSITGLDLATHSSPPRENLSPSYHNSNSNTHKTTPWSHVWPYTTLPFSTHHSDAKIYPGDPRDQAEHHTSTVSPTDAGDRQSSPQHCVWSEADELPKVPLWGHVWPYTSFSRTNSPWQQIWSEADEFPKVPLWGHVWPYTAFSRTNSPWQHVWPSSTSPRSLQQRVQASEYQPQHGYSSPAQGERPISAALRLPSQYPNIEIYQSVYPHITIYPSLLGVHDLPSTSSLRADEKSKNDPWHHVWPYNATQTAPLTPSSRGQYLPQTGYVNEVLWQHVWPYTNFNRSTTQIVRAQMLPDRQGSIAYLSRYPQFNIYQSVYPHFAIYPCTFGENGPLIEGSTFSVRITSSPAQLVSLLPPASPRLPVYYPDNNIYPDVYPHLTIYPPVTKKHNLMPNIHVISSYAPLVSNEVLPPTSVRPPIYYLNIDIYPDVYPHITIYPPVVEKSTFASRTNEPFSPPLSIQLPARYPNLDIYPGVYPYITIYPPNVARLSTDEPLSKAIGPTARKASTSGFTPRCAIEKSRYLNVTEVLANNALASHIVSVRLLVAYPTFNLYPCVYPWNLEEVYPATRVHEPPAVIQLSAHMQYPHFDIYPRVASSVKASPNTAMDLCRDIYPAHIGAELIATRADSNRFISSVRLPQTYPSLVIYPAVYPALDIYPDVLVSEVLRKSTNGLGGSLNVYALGYPHSELYPAVQLACPVIDVSAYPDLDLYPPIQSEQNINMKLGIRYPAFCLYPPVYPHFDVYNSSANNAAGDYRHFTVVGAPTEYPVIQPYPSIHPTLPQNALLAGAVHFIPAPSAMHDAVKMETEEQVDNQAVRSQSTKESNTILPASYASRHRKSSSQLESDASDILASTPSSQNNASVDMGMKSRPARPARKKVSPTRHSLDVSPGRHNRRRSGTLMRAEVDFLPRPQLRSLSDMSKPPVPPLPNELPRVAFTSTQESVHPNGADSGSTKLATSRQAPTDAPDHLIHSPQPSTHVGRRPSLDHPSVRLEGRPQSGLGFATMSSHLRSRPRSDSLTHRHSSQGLERPRPPGASGADTPKPRDSLVLLRVKGYEATVNAESHSDAMTRPPFPIHALNPIPSHPKPSHA